ncbi:hypothetical protein [Streptomyces fractus]|uniref:hypothetical protein n=1 Tax=Streptomyces fractus TaxID=641806 RepID=UPI003CF0DA92
MIIITGPQSSDEDRETLADAASIFNALPAFKVVAQWVAATVLYCLSGWESCPRAVADVAIAESFGIAVRHLLA